MNQEEGLKKNWTEVTGSDRRDDPSVFWQTYVCVYILKTAFIWKMDHMTTFEHHKINKSNLG